MTPTPRPTPERPTLAQDRPLLVMALEEIAHIRRMNGYTGHDGDEPASIWLGASLHEIEDLLRAALKPDAPLSAGSGTAEPTDDAKRLAVLVLQEQHAFHPEELAVANRVLSRPAPSPGVTAEPTEAQVQRGKEALMLDRRVAGTDADAQDAEDMCGHDAFLVLRAALAAAEGRTNG